jgi:hypothetical protein
MSPASALKNMLPVALLLLSGVVSTSANANGNVNPLPDFCGRDYVVALDTNTGSGSITNPETQLVVKCGNGAPPQPPSFISSVPVNVDCALNPSMDAFVCNQNAAAGMASIQSNSCAKRF